MSRPAKDPASRFWSKVEILSPDQCWKFNGSKDRNGRGCFYFNGGPKSAYRVAAILSGIAIPKGMCVCHKCDNPNCCNPYHFFVGTQRDNIHDMWRKGRGVKPVSPPWNGIKLDRSIIECIKKLRSDGLLQREIANKLGVNQSHVSRVLSGKCRAVY